MIQDVSRRMLLGGMAMAAAGATALPAHAFADGSDEALPLWPGSPPGAPAPLPTPKYDQRSKDPAFNDRWLTGVGQPSLTVRRPARPNGTAVMLVPGGGYGFLAIDNEGEEQARWLNALGITAFILRYRLPTEGWAHRNTAPLADAQRGLRLIRANAARWSVDPARVLALGFSAGGHLAGSLATRHAERVYAPVDAADRLSARPDLAGLIYPVVSMAAPFAHGGSRDNLFGTGADARALTAASVETRVTADTSPIFLTHASDDGLVPIANSLALYQAMLAAARPAELHAFDQGGHGFGVRLPKTVPASAWPTLFAAYARRSGLLAA
ncbi:alpha/beta hydrolase [Sphingomonas azotifigens]|uniref:alpha/beta hydrolase n=1 Tax=Sphingomonas azotifigens TaxID=330920 RepID=UPI00111C7049|nr:alpha/beta hydrolase [Sphingomonas azotifigens]